MGNTLTDLFDTVIVDRIGLRLVKRIADRCRKEHLLFLQGRDRPLDRALRPEGKLLLPLPDGVVNPTMAVGVNARLPADPVLYLLEKDRLIQAELYGKARKDGKRGF